MLSDDFEQAEQNPGKDIHFAFGIKRAFNQIEENEELSPRMQDEVDEIDLLPLSDLFDHLEEWYSNTDFDGVQDALSILNDLIDDSKDDGWNRVVPILYHRLIKLKAGLQGHDPHDEIQNTHSFLASNYEDIPANLIRPIVELVELNLDCLSDAEIREWVSLCNDIAEKHEGNNQFSEERNFLSHAIKLKQEVGDDVGLEQGQLVESFDMEAEVQGKRSSMLRADVLERGLSRCAEFLDEEKKEEWKREALEARRDGAENEMAEMRLDEETAEAIAEESQENTDRIVEWFEGTAEVYESSTYALYCLLCSDGYVPSYAQSIKSEQGFVFPQLLETRVTSPEGHAIAVNPSIRDEDDSEIRVPTGYLQNILTMTQTLAGALYKLIDKRAISVYDFFRLLDIANISVSSRAYLIDAIIDLYEQEYPQAFAISIPYFEGAIVDTLDNMGFSATALTEDGTQQSSFGGLLNQISDEIEDEYWAYLKVRYTDGRGQNQRNRWSHGQFHYYQANFVNASTLLFDILKTLIELNPTPYLAVFSLPSRTISTQSRRRRGFDLSEYIDPELEVRAYGVSEDIAVIVAESDQRTEFRVIRGNTFQDHGLSKTDMSRDEVERHIDLLKNPAPDLPEDIELTWIETADEIQDHIQRIIESIIDQGVENCTRNRVIEVAQKYAITEDEAESAIDSLVDSSDVEETDGEIELTSRA